MSQYEIYPKFVCNDMPRAYDLDILMLDWGLN